MVVTEKEPQKYSAGYIQRSIFVSFFETKVFLLVNL